MECFICKNKWNVKEGPFQFGGDFGGILWRKPLCISCYIHLHEDENKTFEKKKKIKNI